MVKYAILFFLIITTKFCLAQDIITTIDRKTIQCKILEVGIDKVRYRNANIRKGPIFEILKSDVSSIRYSNGYNEKYNALIEVDIDGNLLKTDSIENLSNTLTDTTKFAMIYFVFNSRSSEDLNFPIYFNGRYICTLRNYMRMQYKIFSEGQLIIERKSKSYGEEPNTTIFVQHGKSYGINIIVAKPERWSPANIFSLETIIESQEVKNFIDNIFNGFKPFKNNDISLQEDLNDLIIQ